MHTHSPCPPPSSYLRTEGLKLESAEMLSFHFLLTSVDNTDIQNTHSELAVIIMPLVDWTCIML